MQTKTIGIVLLVLGVLMVAYNGFTYFTTKDVGQIGPIEITKTESHPVQWSPIVGVILLVAGLVLVLIRKK